MSREGRVVTANRLTDGIVVYYTDDGSWSARLAESRIVADNDHGADILAAAERSVAERIVVDPYLIDVVANDAGVRPKRYREVIRAGGPTVACDFRPAAVARA